MNKKIQMHIRIVLCGIQEQGKDIIKFLYKNGIFVTHIVTISKQTAIENKSQTTWTSYEDLIGQYVPKIYYAESYSLNHEKDVLYFKHNKFDIMILGGWQRLIPSEILDNVIYSIGQHGSSEFLPKGRGRSPLNWSLILGKKRLIWNLFLLKPGVDDGDVIDYTIFEINQFDDCKTLYYKVSTCVKYMLVRSIPKLLSNTIERKSQVGLPSYYSKRTFDDGKIDWNKSVYNIYNLIRGVTRPYPGAFTKYNGITIFIWKAQVWDTMFDFYISNQYGQVVEIFSDGNFVIKCMDGLLLVTDYEDDQLFVNKVYES